MMTHDYSNKETYFSHLAIMRLTTDNGYIIQVEHIKVRLQPSLSLIWLGIFLLERCLSRNKDTTREYSVPPLNFVFVILEVENEKHEIAENNL